VSIEAACYSPCNPKEKEFDGAVQTGDGIMNADPTPRESAAFRDKVRMAYQPILI
jgi:hypothetical protein